MVNAGRAVLVARESVGQIASTVTLSNILQERNVQLVKFGKLVVVHIEASVPNGASGYWMTVATLPSGYGYQGAFRIIWTCGETDFRVGAVDNTSIKLTGQLVAGEIISMNAAYFVS